MLRRTDKIAGYLITYRVVADQMGHTFTEVEKGVGNSDMALARVIATRAQYVGAEIISMQALSDSQLDAPTLHPFNPELAVRRVGAIG